MMPMLSGQTTVENIDTERAVMDGHRLRVERRYVIGVEACPSKRQGPFG